MIDYSKPQQAQSASFQPSDATFSTSTSVATNKVLKNTYLLLGATLMFSAITAGLSMMFNVPSFGLLTLVPYFLCLWMVEKNKNSTAGLFWVFALTGFMGMTLGPMLNAYIAVKGSEIIMTALGGTALVFFVCSGYVLTTKRDMKFLQGFLFTGIIVAFVAAIANVFLQIQGLALVVSSFFVLLSSGLIMWQTSEIIHGGETNYISATVTLYVSIYNLFVSLLSLLGMSDD